MKQESIQYLMLLNDSGELSVQEQKRFEDALEQSPELKEDRDALQVLKNGWHESSTTPKTPDEVIQRILEENRRHRKPQRSPAGRVLQFPLSPVLAAAAGLILITGLFLFVKPSTDPARIELSESELDRRITQTLDDIDSTLLSLIDSFSETSLSLPHEESDILALQLMMMEDS